MRLHLLLFVVGFLLVLHGNAESHVIANNKGPNILLIMVDEFRFPTVFPQGIETVDQFLSKFTPNIYRLWEKGVKFANHYTAAIMCSPARASLVTGLYAHQHFLLATREGWLGPQLQESLPTYGSLLRQLGYDTPYAGKWHLSDSPPSPKSPWAKSYLQNYGFEGLTMPDPIGSYGQGDGNFGLVGDKAIADDAIAWIVNKSSSDKPFALTASFVNPHDAGWFWGAIEADLFQSLYEQINETHPLYKEVTTEDNPPPLGYSAPPNLESELELASGKPRVQRVYSEVYQYNIGGISFTNASSAGFEPLPSAAHIGKHKMMAPYSYWSRLLDTYTKVMTDVDAQIGRVLAALNDSIAQNTIVVLTSDHGELGGAHGLRGKGYSVYEEALKVPLIVYDPSGRYTGDVNTIRTQLTSSVDVLRLLISLADGGNSWLKGDYEQLYGNRLDLLPILRSASSAGRAYVVHTTDEVGFATADVNFLRAPYHIIGVRDSVSKLGVYSSWLEGTAKIVPADQDFEYYDYTTQQGRLELVNTANSTLAQQAIQRLYMDIIPNELQAALPRAYQTSQWLALQEFWAYVKLVNNGTGNDERFVYLL